AFATGCKRINKIRRGNRKIRVPIAMWPCKVEEKMTLKEVEGKTIQEFETKIIAKDGTITRVPGTFQGYETSEEESVERPRERDLYGFVDHPQLQQRSHRNEFAPHWLPQSSGNMNGWLVEDEDEVERNEVDSDLESTASSKPVWEKTTKDDRDFAGTLTNGSDKLWSDEVLVRTGDIWKDNKSQRREMDCVQLLEKVILSGIVGHQLGKIAHCKCSENNWMQCNQVRGSALMGMWFAMEAVQDPKVVTGTFSLNDHFVTILFDSGVDFSFISTEFAPLLNVRPSIVNPELGGSLFSINLIPLGHGSFDVIVGMDWLSQHKAVIVCHEKVVEIPVEDGRILRVHGERAVGITKALKSAKEDEPKLNDISVVCEFEDVFPEDLSGLPSQRQVEFHIDLVPGVTPIAKSPYRLAPSEMQELSGQLQELQDKGFIRPSYSPCGTGQYYS
ncbi:putative reverse transcriptase domain-containing protein, partial [Tanacetum coccineum]